MSVSNDPLIEALKPSEITSPSDWAIRAGYSPALISFVRSGKRALTPAVRARLAEVAGIPEAVVEQLLQPGDGQ